MNHRPPLPAVLLERGRTWDNSQFNDLELFDADPYQDAVREAASLLKSDPAAGFARLLSLAEGGSVWSMLKVAACYGQGLSGVVRDDHRAEEWARRAWAAGSTRALVDCGLALEQQGALTAAEEVYRLGVEADLAPAMYRLADLILKRGRSRPSIAEARALLERAADKGSIFARWRLARCSANGLFGLPRVPWGLKAIWMFVTEDLSAEGGGSDGQADGRDRSAAIH